MSRVWAVETLGIRRDGRPTRLPTGRGRSAFFPTPPNKNNRLSGRQIKIKLLYSKKIFPTPLQMFCDLI